MAAAIQPAVPARFPRALVVAMIAQFAAGGAVIPFVTLLLQDRGLSLHQISLVFLTSSTTLLVFPFLWGMLADRVIALNRLFVFLNFAAGAALVLLMAQQTLPGLLLAFAGFTACLNPTFNLINALSFHHLPRPAEQFGALRAWGSLGWIIPFLPVSLWTAYRPKAGLDFTLQLGIGICLAMTFWSLWLPHTPPGARTASEGPQARGRYLIAVRQLLGNGNYLVLVLAMFLVSGSYALMLFYSPPFLEKLGVPRPWIGPVQAVGVVVEIFLLRWQPVLLRRFAYTAVILTGCAALVVRHLLFGLVENVWVLSFSYVLAGMVIVFFHMGASVLVNAMAGIEVRATAQTVLALAGQGLGPMFANFAAGRVAAMTGNNWQAVFLFAAAMASVAGVLVLARGARLNQAGEHPATLVPLASGRALESKTLGADDGASHSRSP